MSEAESNIRVGRAAHQEIGEFEKSTHIKEDTALLRGGEIVSAEPWRIVSPWKVFFIKKGPGEFAFYNFKIATVTNVEGGSDYTTIFKDASDKGIEEC